MSKKIEPTYLEPVLNTIADVKEFTGGGPDYYNWLFVSSGFESIDPHTPEKEGEQTFPTYVDVFILQPRKHRALYGEVKVNNIDEALWLAGAAMAQGAVDTYIRADAAKLHAFRQLAVHTHGGTKKA